MKTTILIIAALLIVSYLFFILLILMVSKKIKARKKTLDMIENAKTQNDFELAYLEIKKGLLEDERSKSYLFWCHKFTDELEEKQKSFLGSHNESEQGLGIKYLEDSFLEKDGFFDFFASALSYLEDSEKEILNGITSKRLGVSIFFGPKHF